MKNILLFMFLSVVSVGILTSCSNNNYGICFNLGQSEKEVIKLLEKENAKYRYEEMRSNQYSVIRIKSFIYKDMDFNTIRLAFKDNKLCYMQFRVHDADNIKNVDKYLRDKFGKGIENKRFAKNNELCTKYWGGIDDNFMCMEMCSEDYYKIHICAGNEEETRPFYKQMVVGEKYNDVEL